MGNVMLVDTKEADYDEYYSIRCSPADIYWNGYTKKPDYKTFKSIYLNRISSSEFCKPEDRRLYFVQNEDGFKVGFVQFIMRESAIEIGYSIIEDFQCMGYATEALQLAITKLLAQKAPHSIIVRIRDDNIASQRVALKCGFCRTEKYVKKEYPKKGIVRLRIYELEGH